MNNNMNILTYHKLLDQDSPPYFDFNNRL